ncbi:putative oxidoreductase [Xylaria arbuscula]|nr:putative oxidoreductase [Xylaria arbuscula]
MSSISSIVPLPDERLANLQTISLHKLQSGSKAEHRLLLQTCIDDGFLYLDLTHTDHKPLLSDVDAVFSLSKRLFDYPHDIKNLFDVDAVSELKVNGYKPKGRNVVAKNGRADGFESWVVPRNGVLQVSQESFPHPPEIAAHMASLRRLMAGLGSAAHTILDSLSDSLSVPAGRRLEDFQRQERPSPDILRLLKYHADSDASCVPQTPHTDLGSLTFVFASTPGLQVLPVGKEPAAYDEADWKYVAPRAGHAVVNIGDCVSMMTGGLLKSALHRVGPVAGYSMPERYSLAYLMRPEDQTVLRPLDSPLIPQPEVEEVFTSGEWIRRKFKALRGTQDAESLDGILTGGRGVMA